MENQGFIIIHRRLLKKGYFTDSHFVHLWVYLLLRANHKDKEFLWNEKIITVKRGQFVTGLKVMAEDTGINREKIRRILKVFQNERQIDIQTTNKYRVITVLNYHKYQTNDTQMTHKRHSSNTLATPNNNDNNDNNDNKRESNAITPSQINKSFFKGKEAYHSTRLKLLEKGIPEKVVDRELHKFVVYWTEPNKSGTKERWELQKTFDVSRRLFTWFSRSGNYGGSNIISNKKSGTLKL